MWVPTVDELRVLEGDTHTAYDLALISRSFFEQRYVWRARVRVPVYEVVHSLRIELEQFGQRVIVEDWSGAALRHAYGHSSLCMWYPSDPPEKKWRRADGLLKLIDTAVQHLFKEYYFRETGEWLGEEIHAGVPKAEPRPRPDEGE
jgi:hypothetical protein